MTSQSRYAIIVAGGSGVRMGSNTPKQFLPLAGKPVLMHTLEVFHRFGTEIILVLPEAHHSTWEALCDQHHFKVPHTVTSGGETRFHSVQNGLALVPGEGIVGVHDGVRPLVSLETLDATYNGAAEKGNAIPVIPISESVREVASVPSRAVNRDHFRLVQTPQCFQVDLLKKAFEQEYTPAFTDDASVIEAMGEQVHLVDGNPENIKLTRPTDLRFAASLLSEKPE